MVEYNSGRDLEIRRDPNALWPEIAESVFGKDRMDAVRAAEPKQDWRPAPSRIADENIQAAAMDVMYWVHPWSEECPVCHNHVSAGDYTAHDDEHDWWRFLFAVRRWLEHPDSAHICDDHIQRPVALESRVADHATQQNILDMLSWCLASAQTQCCGRSLGPPDDILECIATLAAWLEISRPELYALGQQRWHFTTDEEEAEELARYAASLTEEEIRFKVQKTRDRMIKSQRERGTVEGDDGWLSDEKITAHAEMSARMPPLDGEWRRDLLRRA
jgi:hypothetical protein